MAMFSIEELYLLNLLVTASMVFILVVRAYIEHKQIKTYLKETEYKNRLRNIRRVVCAERKEIENMTPTEIEEFVDNLIGLLSE